MTVAVTRERTRKTSLRRPEVTWAEFCTLPRKRASHADGVVHEALIQGLDEVGRGDSGDLVVGDNGGVR